MKQRSSIHRNREFVPFFASSPPHPHPTPSLTNPCYTLPSGHVDAAAQWLTTMTSGGGISVCDALVLVSAFFVYGNSGITCINGLIVEEFLQDYQAGEAVTTWVASVQIALSHISGQYTESTPWDPFY